MLLVSLSQETNAEVTALGRVIDLYYRKKLDCFSTKEIRKSIWSARDPLGCTLLVLPLRSIGNDNNPIQVGG